MAHVESFTNSKGEKIELNTRFHREARMRYRAESLGALLANDCELLAKFVHHHQTIQAPRIQELYDYAQGENHEVLKGELRRKETDMADNRAVHNFGKVISNFRRGYLVGNPVQVEYMDSQDDSPTDKTLKEIEKQNSFYELNKRLVLDFSQTGRAFEIQYFNMDEELQNKRLDPRNTFMIYENTLDEQEIAGVHYYSSNPFDNSSLYVDVYGVEKVYRYIMDKEEIKPIEDNPDLGIYAEKEHGHGEVQITEHLNNEEGIGDYETELSLIDLYDAAQSDTANYMTDLADAILLIIGDVDFPEDIDTAEKQLEYMKQMRRARMMQLVPPRDEEGKESGNVDGKYLYKQYDVAGTEAYKTRLEKNIHEFTSTPNLNDENFSGNQTGEAMKYKLFGLDQERVSTQAMFEKGLRKRYQLIANIYPKIADKNGGAFADYDGSKLKITFTPNLPQSDSEVVNMVKSLETIVSDETLLSILRVVTNVDAKDELERIKREERDAVNNGMPDPRITNVGDVDGEEENA